MRVIFFAPEIEGDGSRLQTAVENVVSRNDLEIHRTLKQLESSLHVPLGERAVGVLMASNMEELKNFISLKNLMKSLPLILILPDYEPETLKLAHLLLPRYLEHKRSDFDTLAQVLTFLAG